MWDNTIITGTDFTESDSIGGYMVSTEIGYEYKYDFTSEKFRRAFEFLKRKDLFELPEGWIEIENGVRASVQAYKTIDYKEGFYETHEKFFDIQYVVKRENLKVKTPYSDTDDITFYFNPGSGDSMAAFEEGDFIILTPEDAHKPGLRDGGSTEVKKIVIKVPV